MGEEKPKKGPRKDKENYIETRMGILRASRLRQKEHAEKAQKRLTRAVKEARAGKSTPRGKFVLSATMEQFRSKIKNAKEAWQKARREMIQEPFTESLGKFQEKLKNKTLPYEEKMAQIADFAEAYIRKISESERGLTKKAVIKMRDSTASADKIAELLSQKGNKGLVDALGWVFGMSEKTKKSGEKAVSAGKGPAFVALLEELKKGSKEKMPFVWMIMFLMNSVDRVELAMKHIAQNGLNLKQATAFLEAGNNMGVFATEEMNEILTAKFKDQFKEFTPEKIREYAIKYKAQRDFTETAALLAPTPGSKNKAGEMLTFKNLLLFIVKLAAGATVAGNVFANLFVGGGWRKPGEFLKNLAKNQAVYGAVAAYGLTKVAEGKIDWKKLTRGAPEENAKAQAKSRIDLYEGTNASPGWKNFFKTDNYAGAKALSEYIGRQSIFEKEKLRPEKLKISEFVIWLKRKAKKPENVGYKSLLTSFTETEKGYKINDFSTENKEFKKFAKAFLALGIGGAEVEVRYEGAITQAKIT